MQRAAFRRILFVALSLALISINAPLRAELKPVAKTSCCASAVTTHNPASHSTPCPRDPLQQRQCCAACALALTFCPSATTLFYYDQPPRDKFSRNDERAHSRSERPPVPPPRSSLS